jgi:hypothetical protein
MAEQQTAPHLKALINKLFVASSFSSPFLSHFNSKSYAGSKELKQLSTLLLKNT